VSDDGYGAGWEDSVVFVPYYLYQTYGELRPAQRFYADMVNHLNWYAANSSGFIAPNTRYGDWVAVDSSTPGQLISTAFYARCASMVSELAQALGNTSDAATYGRLFTNICAAFQSNYVAANGTVGSGSQAGYALALGFNLLTPAQVVLVSNKMASAVSNQGGNPTTGMVTTHLLLPALTSIGRNDLAYQMLEKTNYPSWGFEVGVGATTIFELWNAVNADGIVNLSQDQMNSFNHANFGACAEWFYRDILGIDHLQPGFSSILIAPQPGGGLSSAQGSYDSINGAISNAWTLAGGTFNMSVAVPANTTAQIRVPTTNASAITESGVPATSSVGVTFVGVSNNAAVYNVGSGTYSFASPYAFSLPTTPPPVTVSNFSFEANVASGPGAVVQSVPSGWTAFNEGGPTDIGSEWAGGADYATFNPLAVPASGNQFCYVNMFNPGVTGGIYQDAGALQPNTIYTLTVAIGSRSDRTNSPGIISLLNGTDNTGTVLATGGGLPVGQNTWQNYSVTFTTGASVSGDLTVELSVAGNATTVQADFDNVRLTSALIPVNNFSFEQNTASGPGGVSTTVPNAWTAFNQGSAGDIGSQWAGGVDYSIYSPLAASAAGNQYCYVNMFNPSVTGGIFQDVGALQPNTAYGLTVAIGSRADRLNSPGIISLINGTDNTGAVLASSGGLPAMQNTWQDYSVAFTTGASVSGDLVVALSVLGNSTTIQADFDNVRLNKLPLVAPTFGAPKLSGVNFILTGNGGTPNGGYTWLVTTNLTAPINWTTNSTGMLDGAGAFSNSMLIQPSQSAIFYRLRVP
jgi:hypothetical protein